MRFKIFLKNLHFLAILTSRNHSQRAFFIPATCNLFFRLKISPRIPTIAFHISQHFWIGGHYSYYHHMLPWLLLLNNFLSVFLLQISFLAIQNLNKDKSKSFWKYICHSCADFLSTEASFQTTFFNCCWNFTSMWNKYL